MNIRSTVFRPILNHWSTDLLVAVGITIGLNIAVFVPGVRETVLRIPLGFAFVLTVPGYVFVAALYPERYCDRGPDESGSGRLSSRLTLIERCLLAVACSIVIVPLVGYLLNFTQWGVRLTPLVVATSGVTIFTTLIALVRRLRLPSDERFRLGVPNLTTVRSTWLSADDVPSYALTVMLVASLVVFAASVGYAATDPAPDEQYSELELLTEDGEQLIGQDEPSGLEPAGSREIGVSLTNHEGRTVTYRIVVVQQEVSTEGDDRSVIEQTELDRFGLTVEDTETRTREYTATPPWSPGSDSRIVWLVYTDEVPDDPTTANAAYHTHLWVTDETEGGTLLSAVRY